NGMLADFLNQGKQEGTVRSDVKEEPSVYILWSSISGLLTLTQTKGAFLTESLAMTEEQFLEYGFRQILRSIQEVKP
ncbi:MAG: TetR/AcrR family transcriptional regulator, partial [Anaerovoracaceae bacterium]